MPQLIKHCREFALQARENLVDVFLEHLTRLRARMWGRADNTMPDKQTIPRQARQLADTLDEQLISLQNVQYVTCLPLRYYIS
jgi:hypothetical protein